MRFLKPIPDVAIAAALVTAAVAFGGGHRITGGIALFVALLVGWKRNWCSEAFSGLAGSDGSPEKDADLGDSHFGDGGDD